MNHTFSQSTHLRLVNHFNQLITRVVFSFLQATLVSSRLNVSPGPAAGSQWVMMIAAPTHPGASTLEHQQGRHTPWQDGMTQVCCDDGHLAPTVQTSHLACQRSTAIPAEHICLCCFQLLEHSSTVLIMLRQYAQPHRSSAGQPQSLRLTLRGLSPTNMWPFQTQQLHVICQIICS